jgi:hypothetical protein
MGSPYWNWHLSIENLDLIDAGLFHCLKAMSVYIATFVVELLSILVSEWYLTVESVAVLPVESIESNAH